MREVCREHSVMLALWKAMQILLFYQPLISPKVPFCFYACCWKCLARQDFFLPVREPILWFLRDVRCWQGREHSWLNKLPNRPSLALLNSHALLRRRPSIFQPQWWSGQHSVRSIMYKAHLLYDSLDFSSWQFTLCPTFCSHREKTCRQ